jgi:hypothetical protein
MNTGGDEMGEIRIGTGSNVQGWVNDFTAFFAAHHTTRKFVKGLIVFGITFLVTYQAELVAHLPVWAVVPAGAIILALDNYLQHNTSFPIVGKKAPAK